MATSRPSAANYGGQANSNAPVAQSPERDASNVGDEGESPSGSANFTGMWFNPNSRGSQLRIWQPWGCKSLHAHHFAATGFSGKSRPPGDLKSPSLPGASPGSPTGVWLIGKSRPVRLKIEQPWECKSPHADQFGMSTGRADRACSLNSALLETGVWCKSTAFRHFRACSSK